MRVTVNLEALGFHRMLQAWYQYVSPSVTLLTTDPRRHPRRQCPFGNGIQRMVNSSSHSWMDRNPRSWNTLTEQEKRRITVPPADTKEYIQRLSERTSKFHPQLQTLGKPKTFGVYFGSISNPPTRETPRSERVGNDHC